MDPNGLTFSATAILLLIQYIQGNVLEPRGTTFFSIVHEPLMTDDKKKNKKTKTKLKVMTEPKCFVWPTSHLQLLYITLSRLVQGPPGVQIDSLTHLLL